MDSHSHIYIVDDEKAVLKSLSRLIHSWGFSSTTFNSGPDLLKQELVEPGCIIMDLSMPDISGTEVQQALLNRDLNIPIIFLSGNAGIKDSVKAMKLGAVDFLEKPVSTDILKTTVDKALAISKQRRNDQENSHAIQQNLSTLTSREREIHRYVISGFLNKQIADELNISEKTVKIHRARVMKKMNTSSLAELVRISEKLHIEFIDRHTH